MSQRRQQKSKTHDRIVRSAVRQLKTRGIAQASVADVMAEAGLTVGGFYAHFDSKNSLADETFRLALQERRAQFLDRADKEGWPDPIAGAVEQYFTASHRDDAAGGCPLPMAAIETARTGIAADAFAEEFSRFADAFTFGRNEPDADAPRRAALGSLALMVGGMILARATRGTALSNEILDAARDYGAAALRDLAAAQPSSTGSCARNDIAGRDNEEASS